MRRWTWGLLALPVIGLALTLALVHPGGSDKSSAADGNPQLALDLDPTGGWCNTIESTATVATGSPHQAAICFLNGALTASDFNIFVKYDSTLNSCTSGDQTGKGLDANPDFIVSPVAGYDCSHAGTSYPSCGAGSAYISCGTLDASVALTGPWAIAVITWTAGSTPGADTLSFGIAALYDSDGNNLLRCPATDVPDDDCLTATVNKLGPATATPTETPIPPTETFTPGPPTATPTETPIPPTATETATPTITNTPLPATSTFTPTATATATNTPEPTATSTFTPTPTVWAFIDKNVANNCDPATRQSQSTEYVGQTHELAVCLANVPTVIEGFELSVAFDGDLDQCVDVPCPQDDTTCLDSNPDANAGVTTFGTSLGPDWDCNVEGQAPRCGQPLTAELVPADDHLVSFAQIRCERIQGGLLAFPAMLLDHITLAVVDLKVIAAGTDQVQIANLNVWGSGGTIGQCGAVLADVNANTVIEGQMPCIGATDIKETTTIRHRTATPKPTATEEPTVPPPATATPIPPPPATPTPLGGVGTQLVPPETGSGSTGGGFFWALYVLAGVAGTSVLAGGFYLRFARRRVR